jgi:hypothetical protein
MFHLHKRDAVAESAKKNLLNLKVAADEEDNFKFRIAELELRIEWSLVTSAATRRRSITGFESL